jgi:outer membrane protein insertion porin family
LDRLVVAAGVSETNFRGRAEKVSLMAELIGRTTYQFAFFEPYLMGSDTSLEVSLFDTERRRQFVGGAMVSTASDRFDERRQGGYVRAVHPLSEKTRVSLRLRAEEVSSAFFQGVRTVPVAAVETSGVKPSQRFWDTGQRGATRRDVMLPDGGATTPGDRPGTPVVAAPLHPGGRLASVTVGLLQDFRDNLSDPTKGTFRQVSLESAGSFLGGEEKYQQLVGEFRYYRPLSSRVVLATRLMGGTSFGEVPLFEAFSVGGANTLRGYEEDRYRGRRFWLTNVEYRRAFTDSLTAVAFVDAGSAYGGVFRTIVPGFQISAEDQELDAHVSVGLGLRVKTRIGPLRLDVGFGEEGSRAHFGFGHMF